MKALARLTSVPHPSRVVATLMLAAACLVANSALPVQPASASVETPKQASIQLSSEAANELRTDLLNSDLARTSVATKGHAVDSFALPSDSDIVLETADERLSSGFSGSTVYFKLNRTDQDALLNGGAAALGVALCAIPAVGWVACGAIGVALAVAMTYVRAHGICKGSKPYLRTLIRSGFPSTCVK